MRKRNKIIIYILLACLLGIQVWTSYQHYRADQALENLKATRNYRMESAEAELIKVEAKRKTAEHNLTGANQEIEQITIKYMADEIYIQNLEERYTNLYLYAIYAQEILVAQGIEFRMVEGGLNYEELLEFGGSK